MANNDYRQDLTDKIIKALEEGTAPWQKPWDGSRGNFFPINATTNKPYRGGNALWLMSQGYDDPRWCTFNQASQNDWKIRKGEKATWVEYWKWPDKTKKQDEDYSPGETEDIKHNQRPSVFYAKVFNLSQMDNVPELQRSKPTWDILEYAENILINSGAAIYHDQSNRAFYSPSSDNIHLPPREAFADAARYYATALHELGHWTGHESRLKRDLSGQFGSESYAKEELRAELASLFLSDRLGVPYELGQHAAYVGSWIKALKEDKHEIFRAARDAELITKHVLSLSPEKRLNIEDDVEKSSNKNIANIIANRALQDNLPEQQAAKIYQKTLSAVKQLQIQGIEIDPNKLQETQVRKVKSR